jgi:murein DD-endopeptidase MepM/ murein hydrolase activator NlpD
MNRLLLLLILLLIMSCSRFSEESTTVNNITVNRETVVNPLQFYINFFIKNPKYRSDGFDFPVGKPDAKGYYNAQPFMKNAHLGDDWNATTGGNSDLGQPIFAVSNGIVSEVKDYKGGWGNVVRIIHQLPNGEFRESLYAHCQEVLVEEREAVKIGQKIATIGNVDGLYYAHLHLEMRWKINARLGGGYSTDTSGYLNPTEFIKRFRKVK